MDYEVVHWVESDPIENTNGGSPRGKKIRLANLQVLGHKTTNQAQELKIDDEINYRGKGKDSHSCKKTLY